MTYHTCTERGNTKGKKGDAQQLNTATDSQQTDIYIRREMCGMSHMQFHSEVCVCVYVLVRHNRYNTVI
jgi:hypothetical protein